MTEKYNVRQITINQAEKLFRMYRKEDPSIIGDGIEFLDIQRSLQGEPSKFNSRTKPLAARVITYTR